MSLSRRRVLTTVTSLHRVSAGKSHLCAGRSPMGVSSTPRSERHAATVITPRGTRWSMPTLVLRPTWPLRISMLCRLTDKSSGLGPQDKENFADVGFSWGHVLKSHLRIDFSPRCVWFSFLLFCREGHRGRRPKTSGLSLSFLIAMAFVCLYAYFNGYLGKFS